VVTTYEINASDLMTAIAIATKRANNDSWPRASVLSSRQTAPNSWSIVMFVSQ